MRLPRRVPWASIGELDQVCAWIYADENDLDAKRLAVNRLSAWRAITSLPHALESTLALLSAILQDSASQNSTSFLSLRQSYATALIRLVNGLVDPLQLGAYARPIAALAAQLGLPPWLVELRHAATHEDLPSLELLREAARESMAWLLHNYFLPALNPYSSSLTSTTPTRPLAPLLKQYKTLLKITTRDATLQKEYRAEIAHVLREVERWVAEAKTVEWNGDDDEDAREQWALDGVCDALLEKGALVPLSKKKRKSPDTFFSPPKASVTLWTPLLAHLQAHHADFGAALVGRIVGVLASDPVPSSSPTQVYEADISYDMCLARWAAWAVERWDEEDGEMRRDAIAALVTTLGKEVSRDRKAATTLLQTLCAGDPALERASTVLLSAAGSVSSPQPQDWDSDDISVMDDRLTALLALQTESAPRPAPAADGGFPGSDTPSLSLAPGWRLLGEGDGWRPSPIGVYVTTTTA
ncbi:hypothetical protein PLICRDRAFT_287605 [Plicaturopsis crispa FD-325 SS-3]|nr:hypothetical protein PLICRDRAFT_287605 [Plicaturopsis crispa FD-325 SS-3]